MSLSHWHNIDGNTILELEDRPLSSTQRTQRQHCNREKGEGRLVPEFVWVIVKSKEIWTCLLFFLIEEHTGHRFAQPEGGYSEDDTTTEEEQDFHGNDSDVIQEGGEVEGIIGTPQAGFDDSTTTSDEFDEENAIRVSRNEVGKLLLFWPCDVNVLFST